MVCIRCQKRPAIIFIQRMDNGQMKQEGYCLHCARELHIKPVDDLMKQFGMSDQDLDNMENRMESMMEEMGDANPLSMMMNMANGGEDAEDDLEVGFGLVADLNALAEAGGEEGVDQRAVGGEQELAGPGAHVADLLEDGLGRTTHLGFLLRRDERGRGLFH